MSSYPSLQFLPRMAPLGRSSHHALSVDAIYNDFSSIKDPCLKVSSPYSEDEQRLPCYTFAEQIPAWPSLTGGGGQSKRRANGSGIQKYDRQRRSLPLSLSPLPVRGRHYEDATRPLGLNTKCAQATKAPSSLSSILLRPPSLSPSNSLRSPIVRVPH